MSVYGYLRVSTKEQNSQYQKNMILNYANENSFTPVTFIDETMSGAKSYKNRALGKIIEKMSNGDILLVNEFSRLGRSLLDILEIIKTINEKEAQLIIVRDNLKIGDDMSSKLLTTMFEIERDLLKSRVKEGLASAKARGVKLGRKKGIAKSKLDPHKEVIQGYLDKEISKASIAKLLDVNKQTLYSFIKKYKMQKSTLS